MDTSHNYKTFYSSNLPMLSLEIAEELKNYLLIGNPSNGLPGLQDKDNGPLFLYREGAEEGIFIYGETPGEPGDKTIYRRASVYFRDDKTQVSCPYVRIVSLVPDGELCPYDYYRDISRWNIVLDIVADETVGDVTHNEDVDATYYQLGGSAWQMLNHYESLVECGFTNYTLKPSAPSETGLITKFPISLSCEIYSYKFGVTAPGNSSSSMSSMSSEVQLDE